MSKETLEKQYQQITGLYDLAEELASTVESQFVQNPEEQIALVEPLISQAAETADILSEEYVGLFEVPTRKKTAKTRIEAALRKLFAAFEDYRLRAGKRSADVLVGIANIADPIVEKLRKQVEKITLLFMQMVELSLDRIMHKYEIDEFRRSNEQMLKSLSAQNLSY